MQEIHLSDHGTRFDFTFVDEDGTTIDLTAASVVDAVFQRPDRSTYRRELTVTNAGAGLAEYVAQPTELAPTPGAWKVQGIVETPDGLWHSRVKRFRVYANILEAA